MSHSTHRSLSHALTHRALPAAVAVAVTVTLVGAATGGTAAAAHHNSPAKQATHHRHHLVRIPQGPSAAALKSAHPLGATAAATPINISVIMKARSLGGLESKVASGWTGKFLTTGQFADTYGASQQDINAVLNYLHRFGIKTKLYADHLDISANGTAAQIKKAFGTNLRNFRVKQPSAQLGGHAKKRVVYGARHDPQVPANVGNSILAILGLSDYSTLNSQTIPAKLHHKTVHSPVKPAAGSGIPEGNGLAPADFAKRYNLTPLLNQGAKGQGATLGIVTLASIDPHTPLKFWNNFLGLNEPASRLAIIKVDGGSGPVSGQSGSDETDVDVEQSGALAPKANIRLFEAPNTDPGFADAFFKEASENRVDTASVSWGESDTIIQALIRQAAEPKALAQVFDEAFLEMGAQGISNFTATSDSSAYGAFGDVGTTNLAASNPSDSPYTTATGGTTLPGVQTYGVTDSKGNLTSLESVNIPKEIAWGWDYFFPLFRVLGEPDEATAATDGSNIAGSGGGYSALEPRPSYQKNVSAFNFRHSLHSTDPQEVAPGLTLPTQFSFNAHPTLQSGTAQRGRATPDVSTNGDPQTGYAVYDPFLFADTNDFAQIGGVSFVAPQLNGATADIVSAVGHRIGFWNPVIYKLAAGNNSPFTPIQDTTVYTGPNFLFQTDANGNNKKPLAGEFTSTNLFYTGKPGSDWNPAVGLGTPNLTALAHAYGG
jgi:kumamolisin